MVEDKRWSTWQKLVTALFLLFLIGGYLYFVVQWPWGGPSNGDAGDGSETVGSAAVDTFARPPA
jgi:hypothetical protein